MLAKHLACKLGKSHLREGAGGGNKGCQGHSWSLFQWTPSLSGQQPYSKIGTWKCLVSCFDHWTPFSIRHGTLEQQAVLGRPRNDVKRADCPIRLLHGLSVLPGSCLGSGAASLCGPCSHLAPFLCLGLWTWEPAKLQGTSQAPKSPLPPSRRCFAATKAHSEDCDSAGEQHSSARKV